MRTLEQRGSNIFEVDRDELFDLASNNDQTLTRAEYDKLHKAIAEEAKLQIEEKHEAERAAAASARRTKMLGTFTTFVTVFLGLSLVGNLLITTRVVDKQVKTTTNHGML